MTTVRVLLAADHNAFMIVRQRQKVKRRVVCKCKRVFYFPGAFAGSTGENKPPRTCAGGESPALALAVCSGLK
jgi:hypothetical protein